MIKIQMVIRLIASATAAVLFSWSIVAAAHVCENPWGSASANHKERTGIPKVEDLLLCLPPGFVAEVGENSVSFMDRSDAVGSRGMLGAAITAGSNYRYSDDEMDYYRLEGWLCQLANMTTGTRCAITRLKNNRFVLLKGLGIGVYSEVYIHTGNGYMLALTAEARNEAALSLLRAVIENANIP